MTLAPELRRVFEAVSTATLTTILVKKGLRRTWINAKPLTPGGARVVGEAFTLRFVPAREDLATPEAWSSPRSTRAAIEAMPAGCVVVIDARGEVGAGSFGDILAGRMKVRGVAGLVTDGAVRDVAGVAATGLAVWCAGAAAPPSVAALHFAGWQETIGCGGVCIEPGDVIVADGDGAVAIPAKLAAEIAPLGAEQEKLEAWIAREVEKGAALPGLYPPDAANKARYEREKG